MYWNMTGCRAEHNRAQNTNRARRASKARPNPGKAGITPPKAARRARLVFCARRRWKNRQRAAKKAKLFSPLLDYSYKLVDK
jgi:hypothetical protein